MITGASFVERINQPRPARLAKHWVDSHLWIDCCLCHHDHTEGAVPRGLSLGIVQHHKATVAEHLFWLFPRVDLSVESQSKRRNSSWRRDFLQPHFTSEAWLAQRGQCLDKRNGDLIAHLPRVERARAQRRSPRRASASMAAGRRPIGQASITGAADPGQ